MRDGEADHAQTEYKMQCICDRQYTKAEVLEQAIEEYKQVYVLAKNNFQIVIDVSLSTAARRAILT